MNITDLRIGNYISAMGRQITRVDGLYLEDNYVLSDMFADRRIEDFEPIILTEEWMLKFNFPKDKDNIFKLSKSIFWLDTGFIQVANGYTTLFNCECKYVHHLMNLYYCIFNKELILKDNL